MIPVDSFHETYLLAVQNGIIRNLLVRYFPELSQREFIECVRSVCKMGSPPQNSNPGLAYARKIGSILHPTHIL